MTICQPRLGFGLVAVLVAVSGCADNAYLNDAKGWFSKSGYDAEIEAIERDVPPPEEPFAPAAALGGEGYVVASSGPVRATAPTGVTVRLGATPLAPIEGVGVGGAEADLIAASSETGLTRSPTPPPLGYGRARQGVGGSSLRPFQAAPRSVLR